MSQDVPFQSKNLRGTLRINRVRTYMFRHEVDVTFKGELYCVWNRKRDWYKIEEFLDKGKQVSKIKLNRMIRKGLYEYLKDYMKYFCVELYDYTSISKLTLK